jgi:hypothetical protein
MCLVHASRPGEHQDAITSHRFEPELGARLDDLGRLRALLQPDAPDAGLSCLPRDAQRLLGGDDDEDGADGLREIGERTKTALAIDQIGLRVHRVDSITLPAEFARRHVPEAFARS